MKQLNIRIVSNACAFDPAVVHSIKLRPPEGTEVINFVTWCNVSVAPWATENSSKPVTCLQCIAAERPC